MSPQRAQDAIERLELLGCQRVDEVFLDRLHVGRSGISEQLRSVIGQRDLSAAAIGGTTFAPDEAAALHPGEVMGQPASLPVDARRQLR